jgi:hypothetical protein
MENMQKGKNPFSRRRFVKLAAGLFACIPAAVYLANPSPAHAYVKCSQYKCRVEDGYCCDDGYWHEIYNCYDAKDESTFCFKRDVKTNIRC